jgi:hypothetical protein
MNKLFQKYRQELSENPHRAGSQRSKEWELKVFKQEHLIENLIKVTRGFDSPRIIKPGLLLTYYYSPKTENLPYYDQYPLVLITEVNEKGWMGINIHYLPPSIRNKILLEDKVQLKRDVENRFIDVDERYIKFATKRYLRKQVNGKITEIPPEEWKIAINLPFEKFTGAAREAVWDESRRRR